MIKPRFGLSLFLLLVFVLPGCVPAPSTKPPTSTMSLAVAPTSTGTAFPAPTDSLFTATPTLIDTLEPAKVTQTLQPLFEEPLNCTVPCFWGILPGKTRIEEVRTFFSRLGFPAREGKDFYSTGYKSAQGDGFAVIFYTSGVLVDNIVITPDIATPKEGSPRTWIAYSPETLIRRYGKPSRVEFAVGSGLNLSITMIMYFDASDLIVLYSGYDMSPKRFCPLTAPFDFVRLWLGPNPPDTPSFETVPLEKATSLTIDQFIQLMLGDPRTACFDLKEDVFP